MNTLAYRSLIARDKSPEVLKSREQGWGKSDCKNYSSAILVKSQLNL